MIGVIRVCIARSNNWVMSVICTHFWGVNPLRTYFFSILTWARLALEIVYQTRDIASQLCSCLSLLCKSLPENDVIETFLQVLTSSQRSATICLIFQTLHYIGNENITLEILLNLDFLEKNETVGISFTNLAPFCSWISSSLSGNSCDIIRSLAQRPPFWDRKRTATGNWKSLADILDKINVSNPWTLMKFLRGKPLQWWAGHKVQK